MRYEDAVDIERLAGDAFDKQERVRALEAMNVPADAEARRAAYIALEMARAESYRAQALLWAAQGRATRPSPPT